MPSCCATDDTISSQLGSRGQAGELDARQVIAPESREDGPSVHRCRSTRGGVVATVQPRECLTWHSELVQVVARVRERRDPADCELAVMDVLISKVAQDPQRFRRVIHAYPAARAAFGAYLDLVSTPDSTILLPAYIGWSPREGSGVFDPVRERSLRHAFYRVDRHLNIDVEHLIGLIRRTAHVIVVLVHYFGRVDPSSEAIAVAARQAGAIVVEDSAHALLTDWVLGAAGHFGDASVFSLHKLLPIPGGLLVSRHSLGDIGPAQGVNIETFDLAQIAAARRRNAAFLTAILGRLEGHLELLWGETSDRVWVPQTLPVVIRLADRDALYEEMNARGFGVVSLYHTLIDEIEAASFTDSVWLSRRILNLPVHQEVELEHLEMLVDALAAAFAAMPRR
jgi:hypothetical protein